MMKYKVPVVAPCEVWTAKIGSVVLGLYSYLTSITGFELFFLFFFRVVSWLLLLFFFQVLEQNEISAQRIRPTTSRLAVKLGSDVSFLVR